MAEGGQKRSPTAHRTKGQIKRHGRTYQASKERRDYRSDLNKANREDPNSTVGDGKDMSHKKSHDSGGSTTKGNLKLQKASKNRGHGTSPGGNASKRVKRH